MEKDMKIAQKEVVDYVNRQQNALQRVDMYCES